MAQHDYDIANAAGATVRGDFNAVLAAIVSQNSGASAPSTTFAYQFWADTTTGLFKIRNAANSAWVTVGTLASAYLGLLPLSGGTLTGALELAAEVDVASATTCDIGAAASNNVRITGTTTITGLGTKAAGAIRFVRFAAALTLTHNGTSLILPNNGSNITTAAGDSAIFESLGSGNWKCLGYAKADGTALQASGSYAWKPLASVTASASSTVDFAGYLTSTYDTYMLRAEKVFVSTTMSLGIRVGTGGGPTYATASYINTQRTTDTANTTNGEFAAGGVGTFDLTGSADFIASQPSEFTFEIGSVNATSTRKTAEWRGRLVTGSSALKRFEGAGVSTDATAISSALTSLRVLPSTGNIASGVFTLYGLNRS